jgi:hypothetical protein
VREVASIAASRSAFRSMVPPFAPARHVTVGFGHEPVIL